MFSASSMERNSNRWYKDTSLVIFLKKFSHGRKKNLYVLKNDQWSIKRNAEIWCLCISLIKHLWNILMVIELLRNEKCSVFFFFCWFFFSSEEITRHEIKIRSSLKYFSNIIIIRKKSLCNETNSILCLCKIISY